ncbi:hypothetical protein HOLleu_00022 [Holothuria leucospilota]|uniref:Uncharacterized protein n=1 Tax=Holothuria leucospilota TaxID=206669 RepID=A0A9Q1HFJ9_HOLLE|nr:hypothetical protein HOLleu_00022 [Holothuria leucospilota]
MNTPTEKPKEKSYKSKKKYQQREESTQVKDAAGNSQNHQQSQREKSADKDHYYGIEHHHYLARERRRKSRSERNKRRERRKQIQQKVDSKEQSEFRRHVRRAQEITSRSKVDHRTKNAEAKPVSVITQNRLTRKLGLFNQGKKSSKILRDNIIVPESVQSRVEKDLKEILSHKSSTEAHSVISVNESCKSLQCESKDDEQTTSHQSCCLPSTPFTATKPSPSRSWATTSPESQVSEITKLPESPPWEEISKEFDENLNIKEIFPDKEDYLSTVYGDLRKMIKTYGSSQETRSQQLTTKSANEIPRKVSKSSVRRRLEDDFAREEAAAVSKEFAAKGHLQSMMSVRSLGDMPNPKTGLTKLQSEDHQNKKKVVIMETNQVIYKKTSTEELMNAMMDGLQFLKNADEVNKIWSTSRPQTNSRNSNENRTSKSNFYQTQDTGNKRIISAYHRRHCHSSTTERHHREAAGIAQKYFTSSSENRENPAVGSHRHQRGWSRECLDGYHQQGKERLVHVDLTKSDVKMKNVTEDIFDSSSYHHPRMSSCHVTCAPVGNSPNTDMSHDTYLSSPHLRRRRGPFKRFRMMESSDTDDDEDDELLPSWYMDVDPPKLSTIESPKFYPQKMF